MLDQGIPIKLVRLVKVTMKDTACQVKINGELTDKFRIMQGLKTGRCLAPVLFNLALERVVRGTEIDTNSTLMNKTQQILCYADDLDLAGKIMGDYRFETVSDFTYLGFNVADDNDEMKEVQKRLNMGKPHFLLSAENIQIQKCPQKNQGVWRIRNNDELAQLYKEPPLSIYIRLKRLQWAGHVERMPDMRTPKKMFVGQPGGRRPVGKPKLRGMDGVSKDARDILHVRNWRAEARDRDGWRGRIEEARARFGL
ncbi:hypothetical protein LSTR_LSTR017211, partial [Laodelphax striatellus]